VYRSTAVELLKVRSMIIDEVHGSVNKRTFVSTIDANQCIFCVNEQQKGEVLQNKTKTKRISLVHVKFYLVESFQNTFYIIKVNAITFM